MELHFLRIVWGDIIILKNSNDIAMIDTGYAEQFDRIKEYLDKLGVKKISFILLTHFHRDHYGSIPLLVENFDVEKVYFKDYSGLDITTAWGTPANDEYRKSEMEKCLEIKEVIYKNSELIQVENLDSIRFGKYVLKLYHTSNSMKEIYEDNNYQSSYHKIMFNENQNSLTAFLKVNGVNIFLGGDILDEKNTHPKANEVNYQIASTIGEEIDIYKVPHHGTVNCNSNKTLDIYKPKIAIITNGEEYLAKDSTIYQDLARANKDIKILLTEKKNVIIKISDNGDIVYNEN